MLKKTITYEDFSGETVSEDFFFHLSKAELVELEMSQPGGLQAALQRIIAAEDGKAIIHEFKNIIMSAYGRKSLDGRRFIKNNEVREEFESTGAYDALFMELVTNVDAAVEFVNGIVPANLVEETAALVDAPTQANTPTLSPVETLEPQIITRKELNEMSPLDFSAIGTRIASGEVKIADE